MTSTEDQGCQGCTASHLDFNISMAFQPIVDVNERTIFAYEALVRVNRERGKLDSEYELVDTGVFEGSRYFDVTAEYAKGAQYKLLDDDPTAFTREQLDRIM